MGAIEGLVNPDVETARTFLALRNAISALNRWEWRNTNIYLRSQAAAMQLDVEAIKLTPQQRNIIQYTSEIGLADSGADADGEISAAIHFLAL